MAPQWMPQNIQKRLLRYVVQQLSLFSEIDLPNLDVSLGTNSKVVLRDLQLDPEKISIPGAFVRDGKVANLSLVLTVGGGVNINASGIDMTLALSTGAAADKKKNSANFSLAQSTMDLANSMMYEDDDVVDDEVESSTELKFPDGETPSSIDNNGSDTTNPSRLNSMMSRAAEMALSRLKADLTDIHITVILDSVTLSVDIAHVSFSSSEGLRNVIFSGVQSTVVSPQTYAGDTMDDASDSEGPSDDSDTENDPENDDNDDMDSSLMDSMVFSHEEASSLYMSATSNFKEPTPHRARNHALPRLFHINKGEISFEGFQAVEDLNVTIDEIKIAATPWPTALTGVLQNLHRFAMVNSLQKNRQDISSNRPKPKSNPSIRIDLGVPIETDDSNGNSSDKSAESTDAVLLENLSINEITLDLNAALNADGSFARDDSLRLKLSGSRLAQEDQENWKACVDVVKIVRNEDVLLELDQGLGIDDADVVFQYFKDKEVAESNLAIVKPIKSHFDLDSIADLVKFKNNLEPLLRFISSTYSADSNRNVSRPASVLRSQLDSRRYASAPQRKQSEAKENGTRTKFTFSTEDINLKLELSPTMSLDTTVFPIKFDTVTNALTVEQVLINLQVDNATLEFFSINKLNYTRFDLDEAVKTFGIVSNNAFDVNTILMSSKLAVDSINFKADSQHLVRLQSISKDFNRKLSALAKPLAQSSVAKTKKRVRLSNTTIFQKTLSMFSTLRELNIEITGINDKFGGVKFSFKDISLNVFKDTQLYQLFVMNAVFNRTHQGKTQDQFLGIANKADNRSPVIGAKMKDLTVINLYLRNLAVDYYANWLKFFDSPPNDPNQEQQQQEQPPKENEPAAKGEKFEVRTSLSDCVIGLNPSNLKAKALAAVKKGNIDVTFTYEIHVTTSLKTVSFLLIDDTANILTDSETKSMKQWSNNIRSGNVSAPSWSHVSYFILKGFVPVANVNAIHSNASIHSETDAQKLMTHSKSLIDIKVNSESWKVDLCADSAQCLIQLCKDLKPPVTITFDDKYKPATESDLDVFQEIEEFAFKAHQAYDSASRTPRVSSRGSVNPSIVESYYGSEVASNAAPVSAASGEGSANSINGGPIPAEPLEDTFFFNDNHFGSKSVETLRDEKQPVTVVYPMSIFIGASKVVLNLYDGYDWKETRRTISGLIKKVQHRASEAAKNLKERERASQQSSSDISDPLSRHPSTLRRDSFGQMGFLADYGELNDEEFPDDDEMGSFGPGGPGRVVGETAYDSIILSLPVGSTIGSLTDHVNRDLGVFDDESTESNNTESPEYRKPDTATIDLGKTRTVKQLKLKRSKFQKVSIELSGLEFEMTVFTTYDPSRDPPRVADSSRDEDRGSSETINTMSIVVQEFFIIDNVPTSTWNRFATYMTEAGIKEVGVSMFEMKIDTVRPVANLAAAELVMDVHVLPLNLHVDQDTLDFLARFGEFKDNRFLVEDVDDEQIFIQKFAVNSVKIKLDYKPKKVDYNGIRSGHTSEFMNFFILDEAEMVLKKISLYGVPGFPRLNKLLNDSWMPDIKSTQLSGVLAGLAPVRSIVKIGSGFKDLVAVPMKEYRKDRRVVRSLQQGAFVFAKTTSNELLKFGVKLAAGTQTVLENAEGALGGDGSSGRLSSFRDARMPTDEEEHLFAITDMRTLKKAKGKKSSSSDTSLIGKSAYLDSIEPVTRRTQGSQKVLDSFEAMGDSDEDLPLAVTNLRTPSGRAFAIDEDFSDDQDSVWEQESQDNDESQKYVSLYADQPHNMREGFQAAYDSLGRNLSTAKDALRDAGVNISEGGSAKAAAAAIAKATPVAVIRPIIGTTEAISKALLGGINQLDPNQRLKSEEKYKSAR